MLLDNPEDVFLLYAKATELRNRHFFAEACDVFAKVADLSPHYEGLYFHWGHCLRNIDRQEEARQVFRQGLERYRESGNTHAYGELQNALTNMELGL